MANSVGFHWLRREDDGFWNWKDGNMDSVKHNATLKVRNEIRMAKRMYFKISDRYLSDLIGPTARRKFIFRYTDMKFMAYFYVPNAGIQVAC